MTRSDKSGFTLLEAVVSLALAAAGLALLFQLSTGAVRLHAAARETAAATLVAEARLAEAAETLAGPVSETGETLGIAWQLQAIEQARTDQAVLLGVSVTALTAGGRSVTLESAVVTAP